MDTRWLSIGYVVWSAQWCLIKMFTFFFLSPSLPLSGRFRKTWWRAPREPSADSMWPGRSIPLLPGRTGAASSQSWMRTKSQVNTVLSYFDFFTLCKVCINQTVADIIRLKGDASHCVFDCGCRTMSHSLTLTIKMKDMAAQGSQNILIAPWCLTAV